MKRHMASILVLVFLGFITPMKSFSLDLYDDFEGAFIDKSKWTRGEWVREIDTGTYKLLMKQASPNPVLATTFPYSETNWLNFIDPESLNDVRANVAIVNSSLINQGFTRARIVGRWYNDGTPGDGMIGDILAAVELRAGPLGLTANCGVSRMTNADGTTSGNIAWRTFTTVPTLGTPYTLSISFDGTNTFTFKIGSETITLGSADGIPTKIGGTKMPWKGIVTRGQINGGDSSAYISSTFDNVYKNGVLYDDFSSTTIDPNKWTTYDFVREISGGKLRTKARSSSAITSTVSSSLDFISPNLVNSISTKVTPLSYQNDQDVMAISRITGRFYNDGTPGGGYIGDVGAYVAIGGWEANPKGRWYVYRYTDYAGSLNLLEILAEGEFATTITLGNTYTLFLGWNGERFTFRFNNEVAQYEPTTSIAPPNNPWKAIGSGIFFNSGEEAIIEALFDDVIINPELIVDPQEVNFGSVLVGAYQERTVTVTNEGADDLTLDEISNVGGPFSRVGGTCTDGMGLASGVSCTVIVRFSPSSAGTFSASFNIYYSNDRTSDEHQSQVNLSGIGVQMPLFLVSPSHGATYTACSYYSLPLFQWDTSEVFKSLEVQFSLQNNFATFLKAKGNPALKELLMTTGVWKKVLLLPGANGGTVYWRVVGKKADKTVVVSDVRSFSIEGPQAAGSPSITPTSILELPTLSWGNNCNIKFKVWFGNDPDFTKAGMKKKALAFNISNPNDNGGVFMRQLTSGQWNSVHKLVGSVPGSTIYLYVESWDVVKRYKKTDVMNFTLSQ